MKEPFKKPYLRLRDLLDCWPLLLKDKHFIAMSLKDKTPCENRKMLNWPRVFKCSQYQKYCCKIFTSFSLCLMIFSLCHARHVFGSRYAHFVPVTGLRGTKHVTWHVMWGYGRLQEKHVLEYWETFLGITSWKI